MAGRPRTPIGAWGEIAVQKLPGGRAEASARFRGPDGRLRRVKARGATPSAAKTVLRTRLAALREHSVTSRGISPSTTITSLCTQWLNSKGDISHQTADSYRGVINSAISPRIGEVSLREITAGRLAVFLDGLPPGTAAQARKVLVQACALAVAHDALTHNPMEGLPTTPTRKAAGPQALTAREFAHLRSRVALWQSGHINDAGEEVDSPDKRSAGKAHDLLWFVDLLLATGCRPGELAAARWADVDLDAEPPTLTVSGTMVQIKGEGLVRQEHTKTREDRILTLPPFAVGVLQEMWAVQLTPIGNAPLFPTAEGGHRAPANLRRQWRAARRAAGGDNPDRWDWVEFRTMRRTVATLIDRGAGDEDAAAQLGHASIAVTRRHYIEARARRAPDLTAILQAFA